MVQESEVREQVRERYAGAATQGSCCGDGCGCGEASLSEDLTADTYSKEELADLPETATGVSLGCGNPTAVADLQEGETVLDLGSGGGIDVLLSAKRVGPAGFAYGLDMTDEMLEAARSNAQEAGATNVEFLKGYIEDIPLAPESVDVVISNCVINLSVEKQKVFTEIQRVLRPTGRVGITDIVADDLLSPEERAERGSWVGCVAGALSFTEYHTGLEEAGFTDIELTPTHEVADGMHSVIIKATNA